MHEKREHYKEVFAKIGRNSKLLWNVLNDLIKKCNNKLSSIELIDNNKLVTDTEEVCDLFNRHFASAGKKVHDSVTQPNTKSINVCAGIKHVSRNMRFKKVTEGEICKIVANLKPKTSSGIDGISNLLLKKLVHVIKAPLAEIFNKSLMSGVFPSLMKQARIKPLHKGGESIVDNSDPSHYYQLSPKCWRNWSTMP